MNLPLAKNVFFDNGKLKREKENFQQYSFSGLDFSERPISFKRSDFRDAKVSKCIFKGNNFNNADFIDSIVIDSSFTSCIFRYTELYNSSFKNVLFTEVTFSSASLVRLVFANCTFKSVKMSINTFKDCRFVDCTFQECSFTRSSMDEIEYIRTKFDNVDLSGTTGINMYFDACSFKLISIDPDYLGSYFFKHGIPRGLRMRYRGKLFVFDGTQLNLFESMTNLLKEKGRFYEMINLGIQVNNIKVSRPSIMPLVKSVLTLLLKHPTSLREIYQIEKLIKVFEYYYGSGLISLSDHFEFIGLLESVDMTRLNFETKLLLLEKKQRLKSLVELQDNFSIEDINSVRCKPMMIKVTIEETDEKKFERSLKAVLNQLSLSNKLPQNQYKIIDKQRGSIKYLIAVSGFLTFALLRSIRLCLREFKRLRKESILIEIDYEYNNKVKKLLKKAKTYDELSQVRDLMNENGEKGTMKTELSSKKEINQLVSVMRELVIKPNAFLDSRK